MLTLRWGWCPIQTCKSTAHGDDGVTYDIVQLLAKVQLKGRNHLTWPIRQGSLKQATIILIPEPGRLDEYTPISLTSCLSKTCEKNLLTPLLHQIKDLIHSSVLDIKYFFLPTIYFNNAVTMAQLFRHVSNAHACLLTHCTNRSTASLERCFGISPWPFEEHVHCSVD